MTSRRSLLGRTKGVDGSHWNCPSGYHKRSWNCHTTNFSYTCWECTTGTACWNGSYKCSSYYVVYVP